MWVYLGVCLSAFFCGPPGALRGGGSIAPGSTFGLSDFADDGLRGTSVSGEVRVHHELTLEICCQPSPVDLRPN